MPLVWAWSIRSRTKSLRTFSCSSLYFQVIGILLRAERPADPEQQRVAAVVVDAVHDPLPVGQVVGRHPHERDVVAPLGERARIRRVAEAAGARSIRVARIEFITFTTSFECEAARTIRSINTTEQIPTKRRNAPVQISSTRSDHRISFGSAT